MSVREIDPEPTTSDEWSSPGKLRETERQLVAYKWLRADARDPDEGFDWSTGDWLGEETSYGMVYAAGLPGLAFGVNDELWTVELGDPIGIQVGPEQREHGGPRIFEIRERRILARRARLLHRVEAWDRDVSLEFASECARRVAFRVCQALADSIHALEEPGDLDAAIAAGLGPLFRRAALEPESKELVALRHAEDLIGIWRDARIAHSLGIEHPAQIYASAAAASRAGSVLTYSTASHAARPDRAAADRAYAEECRWQARWLVERLGLPETLDDDAFEGEEIEDAPGDTVVELDAS